MFTMMCYTNGRLLYFMAVQFHLGDLRFILPTPICYMATHIVS